jgi:hypothetical protein
MNIQSELLLQAGLSECFPDGAIPRVRSPTFLVDKKGPGSRRMVIHFGKLNSRKKTHAGYLPSMVELPESLARCRFKSTLDMRSWYLQVGLTERAKNLSTFCVPSGRCFRPLCMMFGLSNAPAIFQELMEELILEVKQDKRAREILKSGHLASLFDDTGVGADSLEDHYYLMEKYFQVCKKNMVRIKFSECNFGKEEMPYLGFVLGWNVWKPNDKHLAPIGNVR